jgi:hypothetical protein
MDLERPPTVGPTDLGSTRAGLDAEHGVGIDGPTVGTHVPTVLPEASRVNP